MTKLSGKQLKTKGFTLIEVLVAMVIFAVVITLASEAYRYFNAQPASGKATHRMPLSLSEFKRVVNTVREVKPFYYTNDEYNKKLFFKGTKHSVKYYTQAAILIDEPLVLSMLKAHNEKPGWVQYCEFKFGVYSYKQINLINECPSEAIELWFGKNVEFRFFGWEDRDIYDKFLSGFFSITVEPKPKWWDSYLSSKTSILPLFLGVYFDDSENVFLQSPMIIKINTESPLSQRASSDVTE